ncbi:oxysterol-binding protein-related protein 1-like isoform X2 [Varroa jacobsoni]|nr:oxysterol-binding protein-related protein 1-like isoform X2 [Varroa destructor]XP_022697129.1 oxysterol-binding protein-related protein 1-like isoform X2 [Varroa jacobsoni]
MSTGGETTESVKLESCDEFDSYSGTPWAGPSAMPANSNVKPLDNAEKGTKWGRDRLPHPQIEYRLSLWSILKKCCGKELYRLAMPVEINEPLSFLQRLAEIMEYSDLLEQAAAENDPVRRMQFVTAFAVASLSSNLERLRKPFNPILGETYELNRSNEASGCFRLVCEQVSHHPPISALYAESCRGTYEIDCNINPRLTFWGKSVEIKPHGSISVRFLKRANEIYKWNNVDCRIHNILIGKLYLEQCGEQVVDCKRTGLRCQIRYLSSKTTEDMHKIEGEMLDAGGKELLKLSGYWAKELFFSDNCRVPIWRAEPRPANSGEYYNFTSMAMALNEMPAKTAQKTTVTKHEGAPLKPSSVLACKMADLTAPARTDSRFRLDIRKLEKGDVEGAAEEKYRLEEKQRAARKARTDAGIEWKPLWFEKIGEERWTYRGEFWSRKTDSQLPDLF